jgi:hypothetical protein
MESGSHEDAQAGSEDDYVQRENGTFPSFWSLGNNLHLCSLLHFFKPATEKLVKNNSSNKVFFYPK